MNNFTRFILFIIYISVMTACTERSRAVSLDEPSEAPVVFDMESALLNPTDTFVLNDIATSIRPIELQTPADVYVGTFLFDAAPFGGGFAVSFAGRNFVESILLFDGNGRYLKPALVQGHGHGELPRIWKWMVCRDTIYAIGDKDILHCSSDENIGQISKKPDMINDVVPLQPHWMVYFPPWTLLSERIESLDLIFVDRRDGSVRTCPMPMPAVSGQKLVDRPGEDKGNLEQAVLSHSYDGSALFKNAYNDTLYRVVSPDEINPQAVLTAGRFQSRPRYAEDAQKKEKTAMTDVIAETGRYVFVRCLFQGERHMTVWDKQSGRNVASLPMRYEGSFAEECFLCPIWYRTPGGKTVVANMLGFGEDRILAALMPEHRSALFPSGENDAPNENPVLLEVMLK